MADPPAQDKEGIARWWDTISHHPLWAAVIAALLTAAIVAHSGGVFGGGTSDAPTVVHTSRPAAGKTPPLRAIFQPVSPPIYEVAFDKPIALPKSSEQWESLHDRGGIDVGYSNFRLTLASQSGFPLTITNIEAVVYGSQSLPNNTLATLYTQGAVLLKEFGVELTSGATGATSPLHRVEKNETPTTSPAIAPVFFQKHDITLAPGEISEAKLEVIASVNEVLEYGFLVTGNSAHGGFSYRLTPHFKIASYDQTSSKFEHAYWELSPPLGGPCWVLMGGASSEPHCP